MKYFRHLLMFSVIFLLVGCGDQTTIYEKKDVEHRSIIHIKHTKNEMQEIQMNLQAKYSLEFDVLDDLYDLGVEFRNGKLSKDDLKIIEKEFYYMFLDELDLSLNLISQFDIKQQDNYIIIIIRVSEKVINGESELFQTSEGTTFIDIDERLTDDGYTRK